MNIFDKTIDKLDAFQRRHHRISFAVATVKKYAEDEAGYKAALLSYYAFLSLFPLLLILTTIVKIAFGADSQLRRSIIDGATQYFPTMGNQLQQSLHSVGGTGPALVLGILISFYGARGVADVFRGTVNHVWEVPYVKRAGFPWSMLRSLRIIIVGGIGLILAPLIAGYAAAAGHGPLFWLASVSLTIAILFSVFLFVIHASLPSRTTFHNMWPSALFAAVGLVILQSLGGILVTRELRHLDSLYGTFALVLGLLFWLYLQAQVIVYALEAGTVKALKLYPRSLRPGRHTAADGHAYDLYTHRNRFHEESSGINGNQPIT
jgi:YihY family inner membrane protein